MVKLKYFPDTWAIGILELPAPCDVALSLDYPALHHLLPHLPDQHLAQQGLGKDQTWLLLEEFFA